MHYNDNPFDTFFRRGLNLSLSTDDPLQFHYTTQPLIEEYGVASTVWHYSSADMCEIARNSVLQSGFEDGLKSHWLGPTFAHGACGNDMNKSNVPDERLRFRERNLKEERDFFSRCKKMYDDAKLARRAAAPQAAAAVLPTPHHHHHHRQSSPVNSGENAAPLSFATLARSKSMSSQHASGKSSPLLLAASPKKFAQPPPNPPQPPPNCLTQLQLPSLAARSSRSSRSSSAAERRRVPRPQILHSFRQLVPHPLLPPSQMQQQQQQQRSNHINDHIFSMSLNN
jgi:hypothetical protein